MKKFKALTSSIIASAMAMSMVAGFAALADENDTTTEPEVSATAAGGESSGQESTGYQITVENIKGDNANHTYEAYQIFAGKMEAEAGDPDNTQLTITGWGAGVNGSALIAALQADATIGKYFTSLTDESTANEVADILIDNEDFDSDTPAMQAFAEAVGKAKSTATVTSTSNVIDIEVEDAGYYLIKDTDQSPDIKHSARTRYILTATTELKHTAKSDLPTITKQIKEGDNYASQNTAAIGGTVTYQLDSKVPDMTGYEKYFFIVNDSMYKGLTLNENSFEITVGDITLKENEDFYYKDIDDAKSDYDDFEIVFKDFIKYQGITGADIVITYDATLNENAKVGTEGNPNIVDLTFSNDPNFKYEGTPGDPEKPDDPGKPDEPDPEKDQPIGRTPESEVITYTTAIELTKIDANTKVKLTDAEFTIKGEGVNTTLRTTKVYEKAEDGTFYKLKNGTFTKTAPNGTNDEFYEDITQKYIETIKSEIVNVKKDDVTTMPFVSKNDDGVYELRGLNPGTYTIEETKAPEGYIKKTKPVEITITAEPSATECKWTFECKGIDEDDITNDEGTLSFNFTNVKGVQLPGTGAFGTKLIYALGTIFTGVGAAYAISKKKSKKDEE